MNIYEMYETQHRRRAEYWISQGRPDYASGSISKAYKWQTKRRAFDYEIYGPYPKKALDSLVDDYLSKKTREFADEFARGLMG